MPSILSLPLMLAALSTSAVDEAGNTLMAVNVHAAPNLASTHRKIEVTVLTYNVRGLPWPVARGRRQALRAIGLELAAMRAAGHAPDIVLIQEGFEDIGDLVAASEYRHWASGPQRGDRPVEAVFAKGFARTRYLSSGEGWGKFTSGGLHVLSDHPLMEVTTDVFRYCAGWDCLASKGAMMVTVDVPGLPGGLNVVNTHLNSRNAAKVPFSRSLRAHNLQVEALRSFIARNRNPDAPLVVGGDFNVKDAPERYDHMASAQPFTVVSAYCQTKGCNAPGSDHPKPWLASQDLQAFAAAGQVTVRPIKVQTVLDGKAGAQLSDHDGVLVRYELTGAAPVMVALNRR